MALTLLGKLSGALAKDKPKALKKHYGVKKVLK